MGIAALNPSYIRLNSTKQLRNHANRWKRAQQYPSRRRHHRPTGRQKLLHRAGELSHSASPIGRHSVIMPRRASQIPCASISKKNSSFSFASLFAASAGVRIGPRVVCTASIEPMPVNCTGASAARHKPFSRSRSASPRAFNARAASGV